MSSPGQSRCLPTAAVGERPAAGAGWRPPAAQRHPAPHVADTSRPPHLPDPSAALVPDETVASSVLPVVSSRLTLRAGSGSGGFACGCLLAAGGTPRRACGADRHQLNSPLMTLLTALRHRGRTRVGRPATVASPRSCRSWLPGRCPPDAPSRQAGGRRPNPGSTYPVRRSGSLRPDSDASLMSQWGAAGRVV
jgi:hypothetical protein